MFLYRWWHLDVNSSLIGRHRMALTQEWAICCHIGHIYKIGMRISFLKQYRYVTNHVILFVTNYYIFVCIITHLLLTMCFTLVNATFSCNVTFTTIVMFGQNSTGLLDLILAVLWDTLKVTKGKQVGTIDLPIFQYCYS